ncbi:MAG: hypothetical protein KGJ63_13490 [Pseudomonadota bacterium]|jgi:hypothetical protein|nr:hypothetical protein [Pseudomonadota bacterium]
MFSRIAALVLGLVLTSNALGDGRAPSAQELCHQSITVGRELWLTGKFDAPANVATLMVDVIDGKLPQARQQLKAMSPNDAQRWRQSALITAIFAGQSVVVEGLLDDGANVDGQGWIPPFKPVFFSKTMDSMKHDSRFGGPSAVRGMEKGGLVGNSGQLLGPPLGAAGQCGDLATLNVLLRHHANARAPFRPHVADALVEGTMQGNAAIVKTMLDHGADPCAFDRGAILYSRNTRRPTATLEKIGRHAGLPESLTRRLACPSIASGTTPAR